MASKVKAKKRPAPKAPMEPWLRLPVRPDTTERQGVTLYMPDDQIPLTTRVRDLKRDMGLDEAAQIVVDILDPRGELASLELLDADENMLLDGIDLRWGSVWWRIARLERSDDGWSITAEDRVAAYMRSHRRPMKASRNKMTRAQFVYQLVRAVKAGGGITAYIPELKTKQRIERAEVPAGAERASKTVDKVVAKSSSAGWGSAGSKVRIKGKPASPAQLKVLNEALTEAAKLGASRRVLMAVDMALTQESEMGQLRMSVTGAHFGPLHQSAAWGGSVNRDTASAVRAFLTIDKGPGVQGWRAKHGSLHSASGNLGQMIDAIQIAGTPKAFGQWEKEAGANVDVWLGRNSDALSTTTKTKAEYYTAQFSFTTSGSDENVNWWEATGQLADDVKWHRWAAGNTFGYASDDELVRGTPVLFLTRAHKSVVSMPWTWDVRREASEITVSLLLKDEWQLLPGMTVMIDDEAPISGRWIVERITDTPRDTNAPVDVTLRRRNAKALEPASTIVQREVKEKKASGVGGKPSYGGAPPGDGKISTVGGAKAIVDQAFRIALAAGGSGVYVGSDFRPGSVTSSGNPSDHAGNGTSRAARDIGVRGIDLLVGPPSSKLDLGVVAIGRAFGRSYGSGKQRIVDTFQWRGYWVQIIWRTPEYGGHMGHIHIGVSGN